MPNSSILTGKSGGFRIITLVKIKKDKIVLLTIYSKTEKESIGRDELGTILEGLDHE
jgi:mRNA-degrading endonuclease RelE of RelBE toxin-antitoxin system